MKILCKSLESSFTDVQLKNYEYNQSQHLIGSTLKTLNGSRIARCRKYGVGKEIGGNLYFHKTYAKEIIPLDVLELALNLVQDHDPDFQYNCIRYNTKTKDISFQEAPDFNSAREPMVGRYITVNKNVRSGFSRYIWHHKWLWVKNDYNGFDVADSWEWSKCWLSILTEPSDGNGLDRWNAQLDRFNLPRDL